MWEVETGAWLPIASKQNEVVKSIKFSHDGKYLAGGSDNVIRIWETSTGNEVNSISGEFGTVNGIAFSPDDSVLISGSNDMIVRAYQVSNPQVKQEFKKHTSPVLSADFSPQGNKFVSGDYGNIYIWGLP
jgi:WD40 repeat protein